MNHRTTRHETDPSKLRALVIAAATTTSALIVFGVAALTGTALAHATSSYAEPIIYPARGQTPHEQSRDKYECYEWAKRQSGFDPTQGGSYAQSYPPSGASSQPGSSSMATTGAMLGGAASGAAVAELTHHDVGRGAAIGVLGGGLIAHAKQQQAAQQKQQQQAMQAKSAQEARNQQRSAYDRALGACMEARGYTVR